MPQDQRPDNIPGLMPDKDERRGCLAWLILLLVPVVLVLIGAGLVALASTFSSLPLAIFGAVLVLAGIVWAAVVFFILDTTSIF